MTILKIVFPLSLLLIASVAKGQQTGTAIGRTPGSAARIGFTVTRVDPKPTCESTSTAAGGEVGSLPEMLFGRSWDELVCLRHADGRTEQVHSDLPKGISSADESAIASWDQQKHELHVFLTANRTDMLVESVPGANLRGMSWSAKGHVLAYFLASANPAGVRTIDLDTGKRNAFSGFFVGLAASPDAEHVVAVGADGVERFSVTDGRRETVAKVKYAVSAEYSRGGKYLGILGNISIAEQMAPPVPATAASADDDTPDCTGGTLALILQNTKTKQLMDVPNPKGFDTVLDFSFSPDESAIAVTYGVVGCDYPGDRAQIFLVTLPDLKLAPISPEDRLSVKPVWTPDGKAIVYSDYTGSDSPLVSFELATHKITKLTNPGQFGPDTWLGWR
jgi:hypothetical protein